MSFEEILKDKIRARLKTNDAWFVSRPPETQEAEVEGCMEDIARVLVNANVLPALPNRGMLPASSKDL